MGFLGKAIWRIGSRLSGISSAAQSDQIETESVALLDNLPGVESMSHAGLAFPPVMVDAPVATSLTSLLESPGYVSWSAIDCGSPPRRAGFRPMEDPVEVDGFSLDSPDDLPVRWRLLLPVLQVSLDPAWSKELDFPPDCQPYPYQWEGVRALAASDGFLLADDMGTGW
jgi:hypothetical protein